MAKRSLRETAAAVLPHLTASSETALLDRPVAAANIAKEVHSPKQRKVRPIPAAAPIHHHGLAVMDEHGANRQAELFYLQKQIQQQTQMVFILEDRSKIQGVIEWYDRHAIKVRGKSRVLIYKSAIKYLYKAGEVGTHTD